VHLAIDAGEVSIGVQGDRRVVVKPRRAPLKERGDDRDPQLAGYLGEARRRGTGNLLSQIEKAQILALAEVLRAEKLRQADDVGAQPRRLADALDGSGEVGLRVGAHAHLHESHVEFA